MNLKCIQVKDNLYEIENILPRMPRQLGKNTRTSEVIRNSYVLNH